VRQVHIVSTENRNTGPLIDRIGVAEVGGQEHIVAELAGRVVSLSSALGDAAPASTRELIAGWDTAAASFEQLASAPAVELGSLRWRPPVLPAKLLCVGANYRDHVEEMERSGGPRIDATPFPFSFSKPPSTSVVGSGEGVHYPPYGDRLDWEAELAVVIGDPAGAENDPLGAIFGFTIINDLSLRDYVAPFPHPLGLDAVISKGFDGSAPVGPWITLPHAVGDPGSLPIELRVNGEAMQRSSTEQMIFSVAELVAYYARVLTLEPGDVIATGTPAGVGAGRSPQRFLQPGDVVEVEIGGLGVLTTPLLDARRRTPLPIR